MRKLFCKTLCVMTILLMLVSLLRLQQAQGNGVEFDHHRDEEYDVVRYDDSYKPVWYNITAYVRGYYFAGQQYHSTYHSIEISQGWEEVEDFDFNVINVTYYGLDLQGQIVYRMTFNKGHVGEYSNNTSFDEAVYVAYTYAKVHVFDKAYGEVNETFHLTARVSRRSVIISDVTAWPSQVYKGQDVTINVVCENEGNATQTFNVTVYAFNTTHDISYNVGTLTDASLAPGANTTLTFNWETTGVTSSVIYTIKAAASTVQYEYTKIDGTVKIKLGGGSCPYVSTWNGSGYVVDNNLIPAAEYSNGTDITDYYLVQQPLVRDDGKYSLLIWEPDKHSFLDQAQLIAVDHEPDVKVAVSPDGEILTYKNPYAPVTAVDGYGNSYLDTISEIDGDYYESEPDGYLIIDFGGLDVNNGAKLLIRSDPYPIYLKSPVYIQVLNSTGAWQTISTIYMRLYWTTDIIDLSRHLPDPNGELKVRISFTSNDKIDFIGLDTSKQGEFETHYASLASAVHLNGTDMKEALKHSDNLYAELVPSEQVKLDFTLPQGAKDQKDFIIILEGHYLTITN